MRRVVFGLFLIIGFFASAHPVSVTWATVRISEEQIVLDFKILAEDLVLFHHPHHHDHNYSAEKLRALLPTHAQLIQKYFYIEDKNGHRLQSALKSMDESLGTKSINSMDLMKYEIKFRMVYDLPDTKWKSLTIFQEFGGPGAGIPSVTFFTAYLNSLTLVRDAEISPGEPLLLTRTPQVIRKTPSELTSSYFTITPFGIRHELTLPQSVFYQLIYHPGYSNAIGDKAMSYLSSNNPVFGNDEELAAELRHLKSFYETDKDSLKGEGLIYLDIFYPSQEPVNSSTIHWDDYGWDFRWFDSNISDMDSTFEHRFSRYQPIFRWKILPNNINLED